MVTDKVYGLQVDEREEVYMCVYAFISLGYCPEWDCSVKTQALFGCSVFEARNVILHP